MKNKDLVAIIPAAGRGSRMMGLTENNPKVMLPYEGKPIIAHNLDLLIDNGVKEVIIVVGYKKEKIIDYVLKFYKDKINIKFVEQVKLNGLAGAVQAATSIIKDDREILIILGDIILNTSSVFTDGEDVDPIISSDIIYYNTKNDYSRWCLIDKDINGELVFYDKPKNKPLTNKAIIGVYKLSSSELLNDCISKVIYNGTTIRGEFQISQALELYNQMKKIDIHMLASDKYFDMGEVEDLIETRKNITRHFNNITKTDYGTIVKTSCNTNKILDELNWYLSLPRKLAMFTPHIFDYNDFSYELEFVNSSPIQELFIYDLMELNNWYLLFDKIKFYLKLSKEVDHNSYEAALVNGGKIYVEKTIARIDSLKESSLYKNYNLDSEFVTINNIVYKNPLYYKDVLIKRCADLVSSMEHRHLSHYHGDLFFGNMFYDIPSNSLKVIDPRGSFGDSLIGDIRYDIAKLNHSINGYYDFIVNGLYTLSVENGSINYSLYEGKQKNVQKIFNEVILSEYNKDDIDFLTGILFLTMIPLHSENEKNQLVQFATAVKFLNKYI